MAENGARHMLICGDVSIDWIFTRTETDESEAVQVAYQWSQDITAGMAAIPGGAAMIAQMIEQLHLPEGSVSGPSIEPQQLIDPADVTVTRTFSVWRPFRLAPGSRQVAYRMSRFFGVQRANEPPRDPVGTVDANTVVVIDDANLGFRDSPQRWPTNLDAAARIIIKSATPAFTGQLWDYLTPVRDRMTLYLGIADLRKGDASIGQALSWEQLTTNVCEEIRGRFGDDMPALTVVSFGMAGSVLIPATGRATLVFDPLHQEGEWEAKHPGLPLGKGTAVVGALAIEAMSSDPAPDAEAVARGMHVARSVHETGLTEETRDDGRLVFVPTVPFDPIVSRELPSEFAFAQELASGGWNLSLASETDTPDLLARRIVIEGEQTACTGMPIERIGHWMSVDRTEIESVRSLRSIVTQYLQSDRKVRPLNVAVFGPPGSGKSFAVKQMCREWSESGLPIDILEFNVAQFGDASDLQSAFQRVRDSSVRHRIPLVFWDEFDTPVAGRELGWLARFLAPMQDGTFLDAGIERPIGSAVFVFAGGTHATLDSFKTRAVTVPGAKATDFLSRLRGHVDVLGPNRRDETDSGAVLRRALLIRAILRQRAPQIFDGDELRIDAGVLNALLLAPEYVHGARSIEAIIEMSSVTGRLRFERSALPPRHQIALHVHPDAFEALVRGA